MRRYEDTVYRFAFKVCRDPASAEETLQDTVINVYRKLDSFDGKSKFSTWLYSIVINNCLMKRRKTRMEESLESFDAAPIGSLDIRSEAPTPAEALITKELHTLLDEAILKLPMDHRVVFVLRDIEGKSTEETAEILTISVEATKSRLRRARAFLREQLQQYVTEERS